MYIDGVNKWLALAANIGVIAGIIFLAVEVQQNTDSIDQNGIWMRLESLDNGYEQTSGWRKFLLQENELYELWYNKCDSELNSDEEQKLELISTEWIVMMRNIGERVTVLGNENAIASHYNDVARVLNGCERIKSVFVENSISIKNLSPEWASAISNKLE